MYCCIYISALLLYTLMGVISLYDLYIIVNIYVFFFKQKTAYEMRISDWSSDVCSSDLLTHQFGRQQLVELGVVKVAALDAGGGTVVVAARDQDKPVVQQAVAALDALAGAVRPARRRDLPGLGLLDLVEQLGRGAVIGIERVDEGEDRHDTHCDGLLQPV